MNLNGRKMIVELILVIFFSYVMFYGYFRGDIYLMNIVIIFIVCRNS